jgi:hypothetical protein
VNLKPQPTQAADQSGSRPSPDAILAPGAVAIPRLGVDSSTVAAQPLSTADATPSIVATAADGAKAA